jgi:hypothetical protein
MLNMFLEYNVVPATILDLDRSQYRTVLTTFSNLNSEKITQKLVEYSSISGYILHVKLL